MTDPKQCTPSVQFECIGACDGCGTSCRLRSERVAELEAGIRAALAAVDKLGGRQRWAEELRKVLDDG